MKQFFQIFFALFFVMNVSAQSQTVSNQKSIGDLGYLGYLNATKLADGGFLLSCGSTNGVSGDKSIPSFGSEDIWLIRVDANYNMVWQKSFGGLGNERAFECLETPDGNLLIGGISNSPISGNKTVGTNGEADYWVLKLTPDGNVIWQKNYGGNDVELLWKIEMIDETRYLLVGNSSSSISGNKSEINRGISDIWSVLIDSSGTIIWEKTVGGDKRDDPSDVYFNTSNQTIIIACSTDSNLSGDKTESSKGDSDIWMLQLNMQGEIIHQKTIGGNDFDDASSFILDNDGYIFLCGSSRSPVSGNKTSENLGNFDYWLLKLDSDFEILWDKSFGGTAVDGATTIFKSLNDQLLIIGNSNSDISETKSEEVRGSDDLWIISVDSIGNLNWDKTIGGSGQDLGLNLFEKSPNNFAVFAVSESGISGDKTAPNRGMYHFWMFDLTTTLGIEALEQTNFTVYPNPAHDWIHVPFVENKSTVFTLTDASGRVVDSGVLTETQLDVSKFQNGMYTLQLQTDHQVMVSRVVVQR